MRFSCSTRDILKGVLLISNVCQTKTTKPILQDIKIHVDDKAIQLLGTDLEVAVRYRLPDTNIVEAGTVVIPALKLLTMLREISSESVEFFTEHRICSIQSEDAKFKLIGDDPEDFPIIPDYDFKDAMEIKAEQFLKYANKTIFSVARDMSCYAYNGILIELYEEGIRFIATDGRRLAIAGNVDREQENILSSSIVPVKGINQIIKSLEDDESNLSMKLHKNQFIVKANHAEVAARLLEGDFPNYKDVIPKENNIVIRFAREDLHAALKKASITAGNEVRSVQFTFKPGTLRLSSQQEGIGEAESAVPIEYDGEKIEITFNPDFIMDYLKVAESDNIPFLLRNEESSCLIEDTENEFYIVMPITSK